MTMMLATYVYIYYLFCHSLCGSSVLDSPGYRLNDGLGLGLGLAQGLGPAKLQLQGHISQDAHLKWGQ